MKLSPYESTLVFIEEISDGCLKGVGAGGKLSKVEYIGNGNQEDNSWNAVNFCSPWKLSLASAADYPKFTERMKLKKLQDISSSGYYPKFSASMRYETEFFVKEENDAVVPQEGIELAVLDLGSVYETAEVWVNGRNVGVRICPPYRFDIKGLLRNGINELRVDVTNTLVREQRDIISGFAALEPSGLLGPVTLKDILSMMT